MDELLRKPFCLQAFCYLVSQNRERLRTSTGVRFAILFVELHGTAFGALLAEVEAGKVLLVSHLSPAALPCKLAALDGSAMAKTCPALPGGEANAT